MTMDSKVGSESNYGKAPFEDNIKRSIPPMTKGATNEHGVANRAKNFKRAASFATEQTSPRGTNCKM